MNKCRFDDEGDLCITWGGYEYWINKERLDTPFKLLGWVRHLCEKRWMDNEKIEFLIEIVAQKNGWDVHGN